MGNRTERAEGKNRDKKAMAEEGRTICIMKTEQEAEENRDRGLWQKREQ